MVHMKNRQIIFCDSYIPIFEINILTYYNQSYILRTAYTRNRCTNRSLFSKKGEVHTMKKLFVLVLVLTIAATSSAYAFDFGGVLGGLTSIFSAEDDVTYGVGEKATADGIVATLINVSESKGNSGNKPESGNVYLICEFKVENTTDESVAISSILCFNASFDGTTYELSFEALSVGMMSGKIQMDRVIEPGEKVTGIVGYEVPKNWKNLKVKFTPSVWGGESLTFVANR